MHCKSCELLIKKGVNDIAWCEVKSISHKNWNLVVDIDDESKISDIEDVIRESWYSVWEKKSKTISTETILENITRLIWAAVVWRLLLQTDFNSLIPDYTNLSIWVAFVIGLIASISTCLAVTWWIIVWYSETVQTKKPFWTQIKFHIWRLIMFILGWLFLWFIWKQFQWTIWINTILSFVVWFVLLYLGLQLLWFLPNISKLWFHLPWRMSKWIFTLKNPKYSPIVWALTFLLPCWFTQSMQLFALQSWDPVQWALMLWFFALWTLPVLLGIGLWTKYIKDKLTLLNPLIASLLVIFGIYTIYNWYNITDALIWNSSTNIESTYTWDVETVQVWYDWSYFVPEKIKLKQWKKYIINVTPTSDGIWCKYQVVIPGKGPHTIKKWEQFQIQIDGTKPWKTKLVCAAMGMPQWEIIVE